jgi:hypothetical protein
VGRQLTHRMWSKPAPAAVEWIVKGGLCAGVALAAVLVAARVAIALDVLFLVFYLTGSWHATATTIALRALWVTLKVPAHPLVGNRVFQPGFDPPIVWLGLLVLVGFSLCLGVVYAAVTHGRSRVTTLVVGILFGLATALFDLAFVNPSPGTIIEAVPAGLALAFALEWYEHRIPLPPRG